MRFDLPDLPAGWPWSLWFFAATLVIYLLQRFPLTGIFLMVLGAAFWSVILINIGMAGIMVEAVTGRVSPLWLVIPALYFGGYYLAYSSDRANLARLGEETVGFNAGKSLAFDAGRQDLLIEARGDGLGAEPRSFIERYGVPRAFASDGRVYMIGTQETCKLIGRKPEFLSAGIQSHMITRQGARRFLKVSTGFCIVMMPGKPDRPTVRIAQQLTKSKRGRLPVEMTELIARDEATGATASVRTGLASPLKKFPMWAMGCALNSGAPAWQCFAGFLRDTFTQVVPGMPRYSSGTPLVAKMLGLNETTDLAAHAIGPERFQPIADRIDAELVAKELAILERMLTNPTENVRDGWLRHLPNRPTVVAPYAARIFAALEVLQGADVKNSETGGNLWGLVAKMSEETLAPHRAQLVDWLKPQSARPWTTSAGEIYTRLDASDPAQSEILLNRLETSRGDLPVSLLPPFCRMGAGAPPETKQRLLALWRARAPGPDKRRQTDRSSDDTILYLTLARMGLKQDAGKVEQRYYGPTFLEVWNKVTPDSPEAVCVGSSHALNNYFRGFDPDGRPLG